MSFKNNRPLLSDTQLIESGETKPKHLKVNVTGYTTKSSLFDPLINYLCNILICVVLI